MNQDNWRILLDKVRGSKKIPNNLLCLDPGETTGWCVFSQGKLTDSGQTETIDAQGEILHDNLQELIVTNCPTHILCEDYRIYEHKLQRHSFSPVLTLRLIGAIDHIAWSNRISINYQMAAQAKGFVTDDKLKNWNFWQQGMRHARDAIRHGCYFLLFHNKGGDII